MKRVNEIFNAMAEKYLEKLGYHTLEIKYKFYYIEEFEDAIDTFFIKNEENLSLDIGHVDYDEPITKLLESELQGFDLIPLFKHVDTYFKEPLFKVLDKKSEDLLGQKFKIVNSLAVHNLWEDAVNTISKDDFIIKITGLTVAEYDILISNEKTIKEFIQKILSI